MPISHLFFANDALFFNRANIDEVFVLKSCLQEYELVSSKQINFLKSSVSFSPNTPFDRRELICQSLGVQEIAN